MSGYIFIYGLLILIYGFYIYKSKKPYIPLMHKKQSRRYYKFVGKTTMLLSCAPMVSAVILSLSSTLTNFIIAIITFVVLVIVAFIVSNKRFKKKL